MGRHIELHAAQVQAMRDCYSMSVESLDSDVQQSPERHDSIRVMHTMLNELLTEEELNDGKASQKSA